MCPVSLAYWIVRSFANVHKLLLLTFVNQFVYHKIVILSIVVNTIDRVQLHCYHSIIGKVAL